MKFNINGMVRVRLTDQGREIVREFWKRVLGKAFPDYNYQHPKEDADGWSEWQLWQLDADFRAKHRARKAAAL